MALPQRILVVEDDRKLAAQIAEHLQEHGFVVGVEMRGDNAVSRIIAEQPTAVVLDLLLPGKDGLSVCREARAGYSGVIIMLTGRGSEMDEVTGLQHGADDYLAKPFRPRILLAHLQALLRRRGHAADPSGTSVIQADDLTMHLDRREALVAGARLPLTASEFDLLWLLASRAGQVVPREVLYEQVLGSAYSQIERSIDLRMSRRRGKLDQTCGRGEVIKTVRGVGYLYDKSGP